MEKWQSAFKIDKMVKRGRLSIHLQNASQLSKEWGEGQITLATQICQEQVELIRNKPFDGILSLGTTYTNNKLASLLNGQGTQALESSVGADIRKLTVSVSWSFRGQTLRKDVVTLITRSGIDKK